MVTRKEDLNTVMYETDGYSSGSVPNDNSVLREAGGVSAYFRDLDRHLIGHIHEAKAVVGCVAWLTNRDILVALAKVPRGASIVVQKEDFLRPDAYDTKSWKADLRRLYGDIHFAPERYSCPPPLPLMSTGWDQTIDGVRCMGFYSGSKKPDAPRMHNKFLVFCDSREVSWKDSDWGTVTETTIDPYAVWTGSFNFTANATISLENAVYIESRSIAEAYLNEWAQILALSEPLDWSQEYVAPEWRIGT